MGLTTQEPDSVAARPLAIWSRTFVTRGSFTFGLIRLAFLLSVVALAAMLLSCDSGKEFTYVNETDKLLYVQVNDGSSSAIKPGETRTISYLTSRIGTGDDALKFLVKDQEGCVVLKRETTLRDFTEEHDRTFTLARTDLISPGERSRCNN